jgi:hypothetical protein
MPLRERKEIQEVLRKMTDQEKRIVSALETAILTIVENEQGCACRGYLIALQPEIRALVEKMLDAKVHGGSLRE